MDGNIMENCVYILVWLFHFRTRQVEISVYRNIIL
jgi:hypothetical protein